MTSINIKEVPYYEKKNIVDTLLHLNDACTDPGSWMRRQWWKQFQQRNWNKRQRQIKKTEDLI
jgi:hypothetical protein